MHRLRISTQSPCPAGWSLGAQVLGRVCIQIWFSAISKADVQTQVFSLQKRMHKSRPTQSGVLVSDRQLALKEKGMHVFV